MFSALRQNVRNGVCFARRGLSSWVSTSTPTLKISIWQSSRLCAKIGAITGVAFCFADSEDGKHRGRTHRLFVAKCVYNGTWGAIYGLFWPLSVPFILIGQTPFIANNYLKNNTTIGAPDMVEEEEDE
jgi:hypothetical protein